MHLPFQTFPLFKDAIPNPARHCCARHSFPVKLSITFRDFYGRSGAGEGSAPLQTRVSRQNG